MRKSDYGCSDLLKSSAGTVSPHFILPEKLGKLFTQANLAQDAQRIFAGQYIIAP